MKKYLIVLIFLIISFITKSQNILKVFVLSDETKELLIGASVTIPALKKGLPTDSTGMAIFQNIPNGIFEIEVTYVGYNPKRKKISLPAFKDGIQFFLEQKSEDENPDVVVTATRTDRSVRNTPTRVEVIAGSEIAENVSMRPGEIRMLLNETTGIITQQTSAISNTANIRIQELDGRYTQILRDGFPLYSGLSEGLSLVQIAPLDLKQVEIIKGSSSTLYGGGAIAGLINLVSKIPIDKREINFLANGTSTNGLDLSGFYSEKYGKAGITLFASRNSGSAYDPSGIGLTAIPKFERYTLTPRFFLYGKKTNVNLGIGYITETRLGGNINYVNHGTPGYFEKNNSKRIITQFGITHKLAERTFLNFKNSYNHFNRTIAIPSYQFEGIQQSSFSELSWNGIGQKSQWVSGINLYTDDFREVLHAPNPSRSYHHNTIGAFLQNTCSPAEKLSLESGLRGDFTNPYGFVLLPRLSVLFHFSENFTSRVGAGLGYKIPTIFIEESEEQQFRNILALNNSAIKYERSTGANIDFTFKVNFNELKLTINPLFFYTRINHTLVLNTTASGQQEFVNANGYTDSKGMDFSLRLIQKEIKFFTGYSYTIAQNHFNGTKSRYPLAPRNRLHFDLVYEFEGQLRIAFESYYTGKQQLSDGSWGKSYWLLGGLVEKNWKHFSIFVNGEDLNNARQTKWGKIYNGTIDNPLFKDIYASLEGITINGGIKVRL